MWLFALVPAGRIWAELTDPTSRTTLNKTSLVLFHPGWNKRGPVNFRSQVLKIAESLPVGVPN